MNILSLVIVINSKPPPQPSDVISINLVSGLLLLLFVTLLSFSLGVLIIILMRPGRNKATVLSQENPTAIQYPPTRSSMPDPSLSWNMHTTPAPMSPEYGASVEEARIMHASKSSPISEDPLNNRLWLKLAEEDIDLFNELDQLSSKVDAPRQEMIRHVKNRLREILARCGVEVISRDSAFDVYRHQIDSSGAIVAPGTPIAEIVSPGFAISGRVLRPARVRLMQVSQDDIS